MSDVQLPKVPSKFVTLFGIFGAVVSDVQFSNVQYISVTGLPAISDKISPYDVFDVSFTGSSSNYV